jgi:hypothetical protein
LYSRILTDLIRKNPRLISLKDLENQVLQSTKFFKETYITSALDVRHVELRRINGHIVAVM